MNSRLSVRALVVLLVIGISVAWLISAGPQQSPTASTSDYVGADAVVHAVGNVEYVSGGSVGQFEVWYDELGQRFMATLPEGLLLLFQNGVLQQLPNGAQTHQRSELLLDFDMAAARYLSYLQWAVDPSLHAGLPSVETDLIDGEIAEKKLMTGVGHIWVNGNNRLLRFEPLNAITDSIRLSYSELRSMNPVAVPISIFAASSIATMTPEDTLYKSARYHAENPNEVTAMLSMSDYDAYWLGMSYKGFSFDEAHRDVSSGAAVELMSQGAEQSVDTSDAFRVFYSTSDYPGIDTAFLAVRSIPLTTLHDTIAMSPRATPAAVPGGTDAWTTGGGASGEPQTLTFTRDNVQIYLDTTTPIDLLQVAADLRLIREDSP